MTAPPPLRHTEGLFVSIRESYPDLAAKIIIARDSFQVSYKFKSNQQPCCRNQGVQSSGAPAKLDVPYEPSTENRPTEPPNSYGDGNRQKNQWRGAGPWQPVCYRRCCGNQPDDDGKHSHEERRSKSRQVRTKTDRRTIVSRSDLRIQQYNRQTKCQCSCDGTYHQSSEKERPIQFVVLPAFP